MQLKTVPTKSQQIADLIEGEIKAGILQPGARLYSMRNLCERFSVSIAVINSAYNILENKKLIFRQTGKGTFVSDKISKANKIFGVITSWGMTHSEGYFEGMFQAANSKGCVTIPTTLHQTESRQAAIDRLVSQKPDAIFIDLEAERFALPEVTERLGEIPVCYVNRWEWELPFPEYGVLTDYRSMYIDAFQRLRSNGHQRIVFLGHRAEPRPFLKKDLEACAEHFDIKFPSYEFEYLHFEDFIEDPARIDRIFGNPQDYPTALFGRSDYIIFDFVTKLNARYLHTKGLELIGCFNTAWSHTPNMEFASYVVDFERMWSTAMDKFSSGKAGIEWIAPELKSIADKSLKIVNI
jgi:DNA-binding LacI/PurR family transcriptional regulator